jgi:hypothetical protein
VLRLLALRLRRPGLLAVVLAARQATAGQAGGGPARVTSGLAAVTGCLTRGGLAPARLCGRAGLAPWPLGGGSLAAGRVVPPALRLRGRGDHGGRVVPVLPVLAGAATLLLAGLLVLAGDEGLGLLGQLRLRLGTAGGYPVGPPVRLAQRRP